MMLDTGIGSIANVIQLAIAPVFLLTAVAALIGVQTTRLARAADRIRLLESPSDGIRRAMAPLAVELQILKSRMRLIYLALALDVLCALFVGLTIVIAFAEALIAMNLIWLIALLFVAAMVAFIASLAVFLREIFLAVGFACGMKER